jgi:class 3 adenylate cyclase/tetratricopeptide (TPR) repeat protein
MKCPRCQHENLSDARFCQECATPLARACTNCGSVLPDSAKFCPQCAHPVGERRSAVATPPTEPVQIEPAGGERRQATVLFADISGYTQICSSMDAEHVQALLDRFYTAIDPTIAAYGGNVIDHAGDGVLAVFGAPIAYGNDPERAVRAALEMHAAASRLTDASGRPLRLHIGIASGEVVASVLSGGATPKYTVTGDAVNLAARLDAQASAGETLVSQSVYRAVQALTDATDLGERRVKGFDAPVRVYRIGSLNQAAVARLPLVGRQAELRQLAGAIDSTRETRTGVVVAIRGDPGIGKSRLVEELSQRARAQGFAFHLGHVFDFGVAKGQEALPALIMDMLGVASHAAEADRRVALQRGIEVGLVNPRHETLLADLLGLDQRADLQSIFDAMDNATRTRRTAEAVADLALTAARLQPRVIVVEDIHWASPVVLACLAALAMTTRECPSMLAMTTRFEGDPLDRHWRAATHGTPLLSIDIGPLRPDEARALAGGVVELSNRFALECIERAEGNPLFLEQLLRNARESMDGSIPPTIQSLVLARMDRLPPADKLALQAASVIGKRFSLEALRFLVDNDTYHCDALTATDLARPESGDYLFAHALIQEGVYSSLLNSRKRELHLKAAEWYRKQEPSLWAEHLDRAQHPDAARAHLTAAETEAARFRFDSALRLVQRGSELAQDGDLRYALATVHAEVLHELARTRESIAVFEQALGAATTDEQRCRAWIGIAASRRVTGDTLEAMAALDCAQPIAERQQLWTLCARIRSTRGNLCFARGEVEACGREHERALDYARRAGDLECEARAWSGLGDHSYALGHMVTAADRFRRCVALCREAGLLRFEIPNLVMLGHALAWAGEGDAGLAIIRQAVDLSSRIGLPQTEVMALESIAFELVLRGEFAEALEWLQRGMPLARQAGARRYLAVDCLLTVACLNGLGRGAEARPLLSEAFHICNEIGMAFIGPSVLAAMAGATADPAERRKLLDDGEQLLSADGLAHNRLMFYKDAIDIAVKDADWDEVLRLSEAIEQSVAREPPAFATLVGARGRALAELALRGRDPEIMVKLTDLREKLHGAGLGGLVPGIDAALRAK